MSIKTFIPLRHTAPALRTGRSPCPHACGPPSASSRRRSFARSPPHPPRCRRSESGARRFAVLFRRVNQFSYIARKFPFAPFRRTRILPLSSVRSELALRAPSSSAPPHGTLPDGARNVDVLLNSAIFIILFSKTDFSRIQTEKTIFKIQEIKNTYPTEQTFREFADNSLSSCKKIGRFALRAAESGSTCAVPLSAAFHRPQTAEKSQSCILRWIFGHFAAFPLLLLAFGNAHGILPLPYRFARKRSRNRPRAADERQKKAFPSPS